MAAHCLRSRLSASSTLLCGGVRCLVCVHCQQADTLNALVHKSPYQSIVDGCLRGGHKLVGIGTRCLGSGTQQADNEQREGQHLRWFVCMGLLWRLVVSKQVSNDPSCLGVDQTMNRRMREPESGSQGSHIGQQNCLSLFCHSVQGSRSLCRHTLGLEHTRRRCSAPGTSIGQRLPLEQARHHRAKIGIATPCWVHHLGLHTGRHLPR